MSVCDTGILMENKNVAEGSLPPPKGDAARYRLLFHFLFMSPSYWLADRIAQGKGLPDNVRLPRDFDRVRKTYEDLGRVELADRETWLAHVAPHLNGIEVISLIGSGVPMAKPDLGTITAEAVERDPNQGAHDDPTRAVIAVPLGYDWAHIGEHIQLMLTDLSNREGVSRRQPKFRLMRTKLRNEELWRLVDAVWMSKAGRSYRDLLARFQLTNIATHSRLWPARENRGADAKKRDRNARIEGIQAYNKIKKAYEIAENAARGSFPFTKAPPKNDTMWEHFGGTWFRDRIQAYDDQVRAKLRADFPKEDWDSDDDDEVVFFEEDAEDIAAKVNEHQARELLKAIGDSHELNSIPFAKALGEAIRARLDRQRR